MKKTFKIAAFLSLCLFSVLFHVLQRDLSIILSRDLERHIAIIEGRSFFFNPWQYRMLMPWLIEMLAKLFSNWLETIFAYKWAFISIRLLLQIITASALWLYLKNFTSSSRLKWLGLILFSLFSAMSFWGSDLSYNTYFDVFIYLSAGIVLIEKRNPWFLVPLIILGALNRETSALIPVLAFIMAFDTQNFKLLNPRLLSASIISGISFAVIFFAFRFHYGFEANNVFQNDLSWLKFNILNWEVHTLVFGTLSILPFWFLAHWKEMHSFLRKAFWIIVPIWFGIHYVMVAAWESRVFLVPLCLIFLPGFIQSLNQSKDGPPGTI